MEFLLANWYLVLAVLVSGGLLAWPSLRGAAGGAESVSTAEAVRLMNREKAVLVDIADPDEYKAGHVAGSKNVPLKELVASEKAHASLPSNKDLPVIVVCAKGTRSSRAAAALRKAGYSQVRTLEGGLAAWRAANLPVQTSA